MRRFLFGLGCTVISVILLTQLIDWRESFDVLTSADPWFIALAVTSLLISIIAKTVRWRFLLPSEPSVTTRGLYRILNISFMLNNVLPARLGDVARVAMTASKPGIRVGHVLSSLVTERFTDIVTLLACFVLVSPFLPLPYKYVQWLHISWYVLAGIAIVGLIFILFRSHIDNLASRLRWPGFPGADRIKTEAVSFKQGLGYLVARQYVVPIWSTSLVAWVTAFAINYFIFESLDIGVPITVAVLVTCVTNMAMLVPSSPGYIGVFHAAATLVLVPFGVSASRALSFAIVAHLVNVIPVTIIGAIFLLFGHDAILSKIRGSKPDESDHADEPDAPTLAPITAKPAPRAGDIPLPPKERPVRDVR